MRYLIPCGAHRFGSWRPAQLITYDILFISTNSPSWLDSPSATKMPSLMRVAILAGCPAPAKR